MTTRDEVLAMDEREECAKVADEAEGWIRTWEVKYGGKSIAEAIRARSDK